MKPMLASDWDETKVMFPVMAQPKIDGVRALNMTGALTGRSLKPFKNKYTTSLYSQRLLAGLDGEMVAGHECDPALCRKTASALSTIEGTPFTLWWLFDYLNIQHHVMIYARRYEALCERVELIKKDHPAIGDYLRVVPSINCSTMDELLGFEKTCLDMGYEGVVIRDPYAYHKQGRSTIKERGLLRIKRFVDSEAEVLSYEEGQVNDNEAQTNELGRTFRSTHAAGMYPSGLVGTIVARDLKTKQMINVSPGNMTMDQRRVEWDNQFKSRGRIFTYKHFPHGVKDKPRFPTWKSWRDSVDISD